MIQPARVFQRNEQLRKRCQTIKGQIWQTDLAGGRPRWCVVNFQYRFAELLRRFRASFRHADTILSSELTNHYDSTQGVPIDQMQESTRLLVARLFAASALLMLGSAAAAHAWSAQTGESVPMSSEHQPSRLSIGADILLPTGKEVDSGLHIRLNGRICAAAKFDELRAHCPEAAVLDCRGRAVLPPGLVKSDEHPTYSHAFPVKNLDPNYAHRDE